MHKNRLFQKNYISCSRKPILIIFILICRSQRDLSFDMFYVVRCQLELLFFKSEKLSIFEFLKWRKLIDLVPILNFLVEKTCYFGILLRGVDFHFLNKNLVPPRLFLICGTAYQKNQPHIFFFTLYSFF